MNSKNIVYNKCYYKLTGSVQGAVLLSHLLYLSSEVFNSAEFYQTDAQLSSTLGFSAKTLRTAKSKIKKYVTITKKGLPAKNHWLVDENLIINELLSLDCGVSSSAEKGSTVAAEKGSTVAAEKGSTNNKELHNNKDLKMNMKKYIKSFSLLEKMAPEGVDLILSPSKSLELHLPTPKTDLKRTFDQLWQEYPLKKAKQKALEAFEKVFDGKVADEQERLLKAICGGFKAYLEEHNATQF